MHKNLQTTIAEIPLEMGYQPSPTDVSVIMLDKKNAVLGIATTPADTVRNTGADIVPPAMRGNVVQSIPVAWSPSVEHEALLAAANTNAHVPITATVDGAKVTLSTPDGGVSNVVSLPDVLTQHIFDGKIAPASTREAAVKNVAPTQPGWRPSPQDESHLASKSPSERVQEALSALQSITDGQPSTQHAPIVALVVNQAVVQRDAVLAGCLDHPRMNDALQHVWRTAPETMRSHLGAIVAAAQYSQGNMLATRAALETCLDNRLGRIIHQSAKLGIPPRSVHDMLVQAHSSISESLAQSDVTWASTRVQNLRSQGVSRHRPADHFSGATGQQKRKISPRSPNTREM